MARSADSYPNATPNGRAPFAKGNTMELVHGASSPRMIAKRAKQVPSRSSSTRRGSANLSTSRQ
jgi:hypothetical protein